MDYKEVGIKIFLAGCRGEQALIEYFVCILHVLDFTSFSLLPINCRMLCFLKKIRLLIVSTQKFKPNICICMTNG